MTAGDPAGDTFSAFVSFLGTPLPENPIEAIRILRREAAKEIERLIAFLDALGGDPDLEETGDDEPSLAIARAGPDLSGGDDRELDEGEAEFSLGSPESVRTSTRPAHVHWFGEPEWFPKASFAPGRARRLRGRWETRTTTTLRGTPKTTMRTRTTRNSALNSSQFASHGNARQRANSATSVHHSCSLAG